MSKFLDMDGLAYYTNKFKPSLANLVDNSQKNFIKVAFTSKPSTSTRPSFTNNGDGSITINGSNTGGEYVPINDLTSDLTNDLNTRYTLPIGEYVIFPIANVNVKVQVYMHDGTDRLWLADSRETKNRFNYTTENKTQYPYIAFRINVLNATFNDYTIYPMLCTLNDWNVSQAYVPYHKNIATNSDIIQMWENS